LAGADHPGDPLRRQDGGLDSPGWARRRHREAQVRDREGGGGGRCCEGE
ncbi:hypothetical protein BAE44_0024622, partial [Dichanthelium oligosanthes]